MEKQNRMHPEMAEGIIEQIIRDYVNAGLRIGLQPNWDKFRASMFYEKSCAKFTKESVDSKLQKAQEQNFPKPENYASSLVEMVIHDYINASAPLELPDDWDRFRETEFYEACVRQFSKDSVEKAINDVQEQRATLNKPLSELGLPPEFFGKK